MLTGNAWSRALSIRRKTQRKPINSTSMTQVIETDLFAWVDIPNKGSFNQLHKSKHCELGPILSAKIHLRLKTRRDLTNKSTCLLANIHPSLGIRWIVTSRGPIMLWWVVNIAQWGKNRAPLLTEARRNKLTWLLKDKINLFELHDNIT